MRRTERFEFPQMAIIEALEGKQAEMWTALPAIVESFDPTQMTVEAQPSVQLRRRNEDGSYTWVTLPLLLDVPVVFPSGGGYTLTFPIAQGDEILVVFSSRCIDGWWGTGQVSRQVVMRMHDLSDGFAIAGVKSKPNVISSISSTATQLRSNSGSTYVEVGAGEITVNGAVVNVNAATSATVTSPSITLKNAGTALKTLLNSTLLTWLNSHVHGNGNGGADTTVPTTTPPASVSTSVVQAE